MATLLLHIGHVKTGSTWLQDAFHRNAAHLAAFGVRYPLPRRYEIDYDTRVPAGNGLGLFDHPARTAARLARATRNGQQTTLFSSETLFARLSQPGALETLPSAARLAGFDRVRLLLFVRAPLPLAASIWQQRVKGYRGETRDLDTFVAEAFDMPRRVATFVDALQGLDGVELTLRNYDAHRRDLLPVAEDWLKLSPGSLERPPRSQLNRSLTRAEAALQLALNRTLGPSGDIFALRLGNQLPDIAADPPRISAAVAQDVIECNAAALDRIDTMLPPGEALSRELPADETRPLTLDETQMAVIAEGIAAQLDAPLRTRVLRATRGLARKLRRPGS